MTTRETSLDAFDATDAARLRQVVFRQVINLGERGGTSDEVEALCSGRGPMRCRRPRRQLPATQHAPRPAGDRVHRRARCPAQLGRQQARATRGAVDDGDGLGDLAARGAELARASVVPGRVPGVRPQGAAGKGSGAVIIFSDLHLREESAELCWEVLRKIPEVCREHDDNHVAFLGDWWMVRHTLVVKLLLECRDILRTWVDDVHICGYRLDWSHPDV